MAAKGQTIVLCGKGREQNSGTVAIEAVTAARALSPKLHISYLDLCCLDTRTLPLSSLGITLCI